MSTINPLFLDSTKPIGDKVVTNVELFNVSLRGGESLYFEVTDEFGFVQRYSMKSIETKKSIRHVAEVWLKYQHPIQYRFIVVAEGEEVLSSIFREALAGHIISEKWEPCFDAKPAASKKRKPRRVEGEVKAAPEIKTQAAKPLAKPQFLDQLKSLIDDML